jgi:two-component sensor histidine kinase
MPLGLSATHSFPGKNISPSGLRPTWLWIGSLLGVLWLNCLTALRAQPSATAVLAQSKADEQRALWFREMPHFNRDSTVYYLDRAVALLQTQSPLPYKRLAEIFLTITDRSNRSHPFVQVDSLAELGWQYYQQVPAAERDKLLEYGLLSNRAWIKVEKGALQESIALLSQALPLIQNNPSPRVRVMYWRDKGRFLIRHGLLEDKSEGYALLRKSLKLAQSLPRQSDDDSVIILLKMLEGYYAKTTPDSSEYCFAQLKNELSFTGNPFHHAWYYAVRGNSLVKQQENTDARTNLLKAKTLLETNNLRNIDSYSYTLGILGDLAMTENHYDEAIAYYKQQREIGLTNSFRAQATGILVLLATAYEKKGDLTQALAYQRQFSDEALTLEKERAQRSLRESELKTSVLAQEKKLVKKDQQQLLFLAALLVGAVVVALLYRNYRLKQRANQKLKTLNTELAQKNTLLDKRNAENELLLKEIHHRVKNNLEVVSSLLALQSSRISDPSVQEAMLASQNRVQSMGIIHQKLYQGEQLAAIEMRDYFINLSNSILDSFDASNRIRVECTMPELVLDIDTAISLGLITNELLTNAFKYAFLGRAGGTVNISLTEPDDNNFLLQIGDNGIGKVPGLKATGTGFGTQLVELLTQQLDGVLTYENQNGTLVKLRFKKPTLA